jgi:hypothetical protein
MSVKESIASSINARYNIEIDQLDAELAKHASAIRKRQKAVEARRSRELALLDVKFSEEWNRLVQYAARAAYNLAPAYMGRKSLRGNVPIERIDDESVSIEGIDVRVAVMGTFDVLTRLGSPVHTIPGFGSIVSDEPEINHATFHVDVRHGFPSDPSDDVKITHYSVWMRKAADSIKFEVNITWQSKTVPPPPPPDLNSLFASSANTSA